MTTQKLAILIANHPRSSPTLVTVRLILWFYTLLWGALAILLPDSLSSRVYSLIPWVVAHDDELGIIFVCISTLQIVRIVAHLRMSLFGLAANTLIVSWYYYLLASIFVFLPPIGPTYTAAVTLMAVLATVSVWNDPWINGKT